MYGAPTFQSGSVVRKNPIWAARVRRFSPLHIFVACLVVSGFILEMADEVVRKVAPKEVIVGQGLHPHPGPYYLDDAAKEHQRKEEQPKRERRQREPSSGVDLNGSPDSFRPSKTAEWDGGKESYQRRRLQKIGPKQGKWKLPNEV